MAISEQSPLVALEQPYPGLRAFEPHESFLFFGRETHTEELLRRLARNHFLGVVGTSGGGKSSLVRAGLLPALHRGYLVGATSRWRTALMRPGGSPIGALAAALAEPDALGPEEDAARREMLRATSLGLVHAVRGARLQSGESLLLVVDQFEELFRFAGERPDSDASEAALFVSLLLQATEQEAPIYVVLTMRSDFLGDCAQFAGLPEALNQGQYLIPRLTREQRKQAIEGPLYLAGIGISPRLVQCLLNEAGDDPDQFPVLQHALLRTFRHWQAAGRQGDIDFGNYKAAGGIAHALNNHAEEMFDAFAEHGRGLTAKVFRCLTTTEGGRAVRRPARFVRLCEVVGAIDDDVKGRVATIIRRFAERENSLLLLSSRELVDETVVDISHESLIRKWSALKKWCAQEGKSADWYRDLARDVLRSRSGDAGLYRDPDLSRILQRRDEEGWNEAWAAQYWPAGDPSFQDVGDFLGRSERTQLEEREREAARQQKELDDARRLARARKRDSILTGLLLVTVLIAIAVFFYQERRKERDIAAKTQEVLQKQDALKTAQEEAARAQEKVEETRRELLTANEADRRKLEEQLKQEENARRDSQTEADRVRAQLKGLQGSQVLQTSDHGSLLKRIDELQAQLAQMTGERDSLQSDIDTYKTAQTRDASYWRDRATQAEKQLRAGTSKITELERRNEPPTFVNLPQYSVIHLKESAFANRVALCVGDLQSTNSSSIWVWTSSGKEALPQPFYKDEKMARQLLGRLGPCQAEGEDGRWCFVAQKERTVTRKQQLGSFRLGGVPYTLVAAGWGHSGTGASDVISLVIYAAQPTPARAK